MNGREFDFWLQGQLMEMHQVRYFLAVARTLNFTRAADECNVTQPSLTRAIKQLEAELGGDLFRRERPAVQLTELGTRMHPLLKQCFDAASSARSLASSLKQGNIGTLRIAITESVDLALLMPHLEQLRRRFSTVEFKLMRGDVEEVGSYLKRGDAELAVATEIAPEWDRLDHWALFTEPFRLVLNERNPLTEKASLQLEDLKESELLSSGFCEHAERLRDALRSHEIDADRCHEISTHHDLTKMLEADIGVALAPDSTSFPSTIRSLPIDDLDVRRSVQLYGVAGRERTAVACALMKMLRSTDWRQLGGEIMTAKLRPTTNVAVVAA
jgi:DNA-binding transcriptional LysR family regulator